VQHGSLIRNARKHGSDLWQFRWSEKGLHGKRIYRKRVIGTVEQYSDQDSARRAVAGLLSEINSGDLRIKSNLMTVSQLCDHFEQRELARDDMWRSYSIKKAFHSGTMLG
jgi:integrase